MSVLLKDLSDYIQPSQACIKPIEASKKPESSQSVEEAVKISLNDCLACSGCITSAESILVNLQTSDELFKAIEEGCFVVASVSAQTIASIATKYDLSLEKTWRKLIWFLHSLGIQKVFNISMARNFSLFAAAEELSERLESNKAVPVICSACPGWICYAEKTHDFLLPNISTVKSPQQIMGSIVKNCYEFESKGEKRLFHIALMPCYDKKLEASRKDFETQGIRDVDCVLTSSEIEKLWINKNLDFRLLSEFEVEPEFCTTIGNYGSSAGGFLEFQLGFWMKKLPNSEMKVVEKSKDLTEYTILSNGEVKLKFASVYGFKNIQNFVRKLKTKKCDYHYVEVMACPSACIAGGGQLKSETETQKEFIIRSLKTYKSEQEPNPLDFQNHELYTELKEKGYLYTQYHAVPKDTFNLNTQW